MRNKSRFFAVMLIVLLLTGSIPAGAGEANEYEWAIFWYLCGSDLETRLSAATLELLEMREVQLPGDVVVVAMAGGAKEWHNEDFAPGSTNLAEYNADGLFVLETESQNMGDPNTLAEFLLFCEEAYPAKKKALFFWNHGGGFQSGVCFDEVYGNDGLTTDEMYAALRAVYDDDMENPPFEVIGFDACLMATLETAGALSGMGKYMVASEELEPGCGWDYTGWLAALAEDPSMGGAALGEIICDTYQQHCETFGRGDSITLSCVDLGVIPALQTAVNNIGVEGIVSSIVHHDTFFGDFTRSAVAAESYSVELGYELVDLGDFMRQTVGLMPDTVETVQALLDAAVVYRINGPYRAQSSGLSCYFPYNGNPNVLEVHKSINNNEAYSLLYAYMLSGSLSEGEIATLNKAMANGYMEIPDVYSYYHDEYFDGFASEGSDDWSDGFAIEELPDAEYYDLTDLEDHPIVIEDGAWAVLDIGPEYAGQLKTVNFLLAGLYEDDESGMYFLGQDNDITADWENGVFTDNFRGIWGAIDDHIVYMQVAYECEDYMLYEIPLLINGEAYLLTVSYDYRDEAYHILTATPDTGDSEMASKDQYVLYPGDEITTVHTYIDLETGESEDFAFETFLYQEDSCFDEFLLYEGDYVFMFDMIDYRNASALSEMVLVHIDEEGYITMYD